MFDGRFRAPIERAVKPVGDTLRRTRLTPDQLTMAGLVLAVAAAVTIGAGYLLAGFILVVLAALPDMLDGALAKAAGASSQRGAFFDSVADRVTDMLLFGGVAWYFAADDRGRPGHAAGGRHGAVHAHQLPAGQGRVARPRGQGRAHGAGRAHHPAVPRACSSPSCSSPSCG